MNKHTNSLKSIYFRSENGFPGIEDSRPDYPGLNNLKKKTEENIPKNYYLAVVDNGVLVYSKTKGKMVPIPRIG